MTLQPRAYPVVELADPQGCSRCQEPTRHLLNEGTRLICRRCLSEILTADPREECEQ